MIRSIFFFKCDMAWMNASYSFSYRLCKKIANFPQCAHVFVSKLQRTSYFKTHYFYVCSILYREDDEEWERKKTGAKTNKQKRQRKWINKDEDTHKWIERNSKSRSVRGIALWYFVLSVHISIMFCQRIRLINLMCHFSSVVLHHLHAPVFTFFAAAAAAAAGFCFHAWVCVREPFRTTQCNRPRQKCPEKWDLFIYELFQENNNLRFIFLIC